MDLQRLYNKNRQLIWATVVGITSFRLFHYSQLLFYIPIKLDPENSFILSWNLALFVYLGMIFYMMLRTDHEKMLQRSKSEYEKKPVMLALVTMASITSMVTIINELGLAAKSEGTQATFHVCLTLSTIVASWLCIHTIFALYYAHFYYHDDHDSEYPLDFPHDSKPDYFDFIYFSFGIGTSAQSSDVAFVSKILRRVGTLHSLLSYFFNTAILALLMDMVGSLLHH